MKDYTTILEWSDEEILKEVDDIKYLYGLKDVIRYGIERKEELTTQSVAEHSALMILLAKYFLKLEKNLDHLDVIKIYEMIMVHDIVEIETGDYPTFKRTDEINKKEEEMLAVVGRKSPELLSKNIVDYVDEYERQTSEEARFVKALDKFEPSFYMMGDAGKKMIREGTKLTRKQFEYCKEKEAYAVSDYPVMAKFHRIITEYLEENNYFIADE